MTEVEIKLAIGPAEPAKRDIEALGAVLEHPRGYEENVLLDLPGSELRSRGVVLRVRTYEGEGTLTYKEPASGPKGFKSRGELETPIAQPQEMIQILERSGLRPIWRYAKHRTIYKSGDLSIMIDETPIGNYLELEGPREAIDTFAARLGKSSNSYITANYRTLQEEWCRARGMAAGDLLFEQETT